jgi:hypothetical protein
MYGFLIVEPANDAGRYDQEVLLAAHHWEGTWVSMQDIRTGPPPDNGLEVLYASASFNDKISATASRSASAKASASCSDCSMQARPRTSHWRSPATALR